MSDLQDDVSKVLEAEAVIRGLAKEMAKATGIAQNVEAVERRLQQASDALDQGRKSLEGAQDSLSESTQALGQTGDRLTQSTQGLHAKVQETMADLRGHAEQTRQRLAAQGADIARLSRLMTVALVLTGGGLAAAICVIVLLFLLR